MLLPYSNFGVKIEDELTFSDHVVSISRSCHQKNRKDPNWTGLFQCSGVCGIQPTKVGPRHPTADHWLPVAVHIHFMIYRILAGSAPSACCPMSAVFCILYTGTTIQTTTSPALYKQGQPTLPLKSSLKHNSSKSIILKQMFGNNQKCFQTEQGKVS